MKFFLAAVALTGALLLSGPAIRAGEIKVKDGQVIGFLGDSITEQGSGPSGYVHLVIMGLKAMGVKATAIPAGRSGQASGAIRTRLGAVLDKGANWVTINSGANDLRLVREGNAEGGLDGYRRNMIAMVEAAKARGAEVVLLTTTHSPRNEEIVPYNEFVRTYAQEHQVLLADVNRAFRAVLESPVPAGYQGEPDHRLLADGVHPNQAGQTLIAKTILLTLGVTEGDFPKIEKEWMENPRGKGVKIGHSEEGNDYIYLSRNQYDGVEAITKVKRGDARAIIKNLWKEALEKAPKSADSEAAAGFAQAQIGAMVDRYISENK